VTRSEKEATRLSIIAADAIISAVVILIAKSPDFLN